MKFDHEVSLTKYLLHAAGEEEAVNIIKDIDPVIFQSFACRSAVETIKKTVAQGIWPTVDKLHKEIDSSVVAALETAFCEADCTIDPHSSLKTIQDDWEVTKSLEILSKGFHGLKDGTTNLSNVIRSLEFARVKTDGWQEWDLFDVIEDLKSGKPIANESSFRNLITTGLSDIDVALASPPGAYGVIGAMPGVGKTSLLLQVAALSAINGTKTCAMSLETPGNVLKAKTAASYLNAFGSDFHVNTLLRRGVQMHKSIVSNISKDQLKIQFHPAGLPWQELEAMIRRRKEEGFELFFIDYFTLLEPPSFDSRKNEYSLYADMSKACKALCASLEVAIVFIVQPNSEGKFGERPDPSQLATSRQVFRDYDFGLYLWPDKIKNEEYQRNKGEHYRVIRAWLHKNRLFNSEESIKSEPEVWVEAELRRNFFREIPEPMMCPSGADITIGRNRL